MIKLKRVLPIVIFVLIALFVTSCGGCAEHTDANKDAICDECGEKIECEACVDADCNAKCDVCGKTVACAKCTDTDGDELCDTCGGAVPAEKALVLSDGNDITFNIIMATDIPSNARSYVADNIISVYRGMDIPARAITEGSANDEVTEVEILIGGVENRGDEYKSPFYLLGEQGYEIRLVGGKVVINGGSEEALCRALELFRDNVLRLADGILHPVKMTEHDEIRVAQTEFDIDSISLGGEVLTGGSIATDTQNEHFMTAARDIQDAIYKKAGIWLSIKDATAEDARIVLTNIPRVYSDESFVISTEDGVLDIRCAFANKLTAKVKEFITNEIASKSGTLSISGEIMRSDISFVTYEDFGAVGDGVTDDFAAINKTHTFANESGQKVLGTPGKTYYIFQTGGFSAEIKTNVDWRGASFIIDDREISSKTNGKNYNLGQSHIFKVARDEIGAAITATEEVREALCEAGLNPSTKSIDLSILGVRGSVMIVPYNSSHKVYRRRGYSAWTGSSMNECIVINADGSISDETPIVFDYTTVSTLYIYPLDESTALTVENGTFTTRASRVNIYNVSTGTGSGSYIKRGIAVNRSYTTVKNVKHYVTDEITLAEQFDENGNKVKAGAHYNGFFTASNANEVTFEDCVLSGRRYYGISGTYDLSATRVNKIVFKNCTQHNFWVTVDEDYNIIPAKEGDEGAVTSMSTASVNGGATKMHWGIGGTNYCKNMEYIGSTLSRLDAHAGLLNGKIIDSTVNYISLVGGGDFIIENSRWFAEGPSYTQNSLFHLRNDYGSTWNGTITARNVRAHVYTTKTAYLFYNTYNNWYYGYTCHFPNLDAEGLEFYDIQTMQALPEGYEIHLTGTTISATSKKHLPESHTAPYFPTIDADGNKKIDEPLFDRDLDGKIDGPCDLDGDGVVGNTSLDYTGSSTGGKKHSESFVNLNITVPPEFIKIKGNTQGIVYVIANTAKNGISDGCYYSEVDSFGGFLGGTKFYYSDEDYLLGSDHNEQTETETFKFQ